VFQNGRVSGLKSNEWRVFQRYKIKAAKKAISPYKIKYAAVNQHYEIVQLFKPKP